MVTKGETWGEDKLEGWEGWEDNQKGPTVQHRELYSISYNNLYGKIL